MTYSSLAAITSVSPSSIYIGLVTAGQTMSSKSTLTSEISSSLTCWQSPVNFLSWQVNLLSALSTLQVMLWAPRRPRAPSSHQLPSLAQFPPTYPWVLEQFLFGCPALALIRVSCLTLRSAFTVWIYWPAHGSNYFVRLCWNVVLSVFGWKQARLRVLQFNCKVCA